MITIKWSPCGCVTTLHDDVDPAAFLERGCPNPEHRKNSVGEVVPEQKPEKPAETKPEASGAEPDTKATPDSGGKGKKKSGS